MRGPLVLLGALAALACARPEPALRPPPPRPGTLSEADVPEPVRRALAAHPAAPALPLVLVTPADGAVLPWTFPAGTFQWRDGYQANWFRVRVSRADGTSIDTVYAKERRVDLDGARWAKIREAASEGGELQVELVAASVLPSGRVLRGPTRQVARVRFSGPGEHPTGRILYADRMRFAGSGPGPVVAEMRNAVALSLDMNGQSQTVIEALPLPARATPVAAQEPPSGGHEGPRPEGQGGPDSGPPPDGPRGSEAVEEGAKGGDSWQLVPEALSEVPEHRRSRSVDFSGVTRRPDTPAWGHVSRRYKDTCLSCHSASADGTRLAIVTIDRETAHPGYSATGGTTVILRTSDQALLAELPSARDAAFHPHDPDLVLYAQMGMETNLMRRTSTSHGDLRVRNLSTGEDRPVPGASDPRRVEAMGRWSPDGTRIVFVRARPDEPLQGRRGKMDLAVVPWTGGEDDVHATPLPGASDNGTTNLSPTWSPDGRWIVFVRADQGVFAPLSADLWVVPAGGGEARRLAASSDAMDTQPAFSPDGRWLVFRSNRDAVDRPHAYVTRFLEAGTTAPPLPVPGAGDAQAEIDYVTWVPSRAEGWP